MTVVHKLNESFSSIEAPPEQIKKWFDFLKVERPGAWFDAAVQRGFKSPYESFSSIQNKQLLVMNGHLELLGLKQTEVPEYTEQDVDDFYNEIKPELPFEPYDYQLKAFKESITGVKQINRMCTSCLDGDSKINIIIEDYSEDEIMKLLEE